jgi:hypothetical protein
MGMFDYVRCKYPLPDGAPTDGYQSKDTPAQYLEHYEIREDGSLWGEEYDIEDRSDPTKTGLARGGRMTRVNRRAVPCDYSGQIHFYHDEWDFLASFVRGRMQALRNTTDPDNPVEIAVTEAAGKVERC